jgi:alkylhydroperoxidase family enzyme
MHTTDAWLAGEAEQRIYALSAWRETPFFTGRERAALTWTEAVTCISPESVRVRKLTFAIVTINAWNRLAISFRSVPGTYQPAGAKAA